MLYEFLVTFGDCYPKLVLVEVGILNCTRYDASPTTYFTPTIFIVPCSKKIGKLAYFPRWPRTRKHVIVIVLVMCTSSIRLSKTTRWRHDYCVHECNELHAIFPSSFGVVYSCARALQNSSIIQASEEEEEEKKAFVLLLAVALSERKKKWVEKETGRKKKFSLLLPRCLRAAIRCCCCFSSLSVDKYGKIYQSNVYICSFR